MSLAPGTKLGPYEISLPLGSGGMGEVYRARDTRLERTVAIKILPSHLSSDPVRKQRFEREAKTISSLNHPHICTLHDIGSQAGVDYLVMECVEGETLAKRLEKGPLPFDQVLKYGAQIADALDKAHRAEIVHRDLKPGNIMLTPSGAKLLDFGLAKPVAQLSGMTLSAAVPTAPVTQEGMVVGTFQYMSPEQIEGKEVDGRSDIFSLGAVLYEMVTGQRAFEGKSQLSVASAIVEKEPVPISVVKPMTPPSLEHIVKKCLAKQPDERWQSASDLASELKWIAERGSGTARAAPTRQKSYGQLIWLSALVVTGCALFAAGYFGRGAPSRQVMRASLPPPADATFMISSSVADTMALSPDGRLLVFVAQAKGNPPQLWLRSLDSVESHPLNGTQNGNAPFWSPDGRWIAFFAEGKLKKMEASGGPVESLWDAPLGRGGTWNRDGLILFSPNVSQPLYEIAAAGGSAKPLTQMDASREEVTHRWPIFLPDGKHYLFFVRAANQAATGIYGGSLGSDQHTLIVSSSTNGIYAEPGYLLFVRGYVLMAQPFDAKRMQVSGEAVAVAAGVTASLPINFGNFSVSQTGTLVYSSASVELKRGLYWYDRQGKQLSMLGTPEYSSYPELSPDGKRLALRLFTQPGGNFEIWAYDLARGVHARESFSALTAFAPVWSPDGQQLVYSHGASGISGDHMYLLNVGGTGKEELLEQPFLESLANYPTSWSPDGDYLLFDRQDKTGKTAVWVLPIKGSRKPYPLVETQFNAQAGRFSPDGRWVAYVSNDSGKEEVYVMPFPGPGAREQVSTGGGTQPRWRKGGRELFYLSPEAKMMAADVTTDTEAFRAGAVKTLFALSGVAGVPGQLYDVTPDGQRFIAVQDLVHTSTAPLTLVVNWDAELQKK